MALSKEQFLQYRRSGMSIDDIVGMGDTEKARVSAGIKEHLAQPAKYDPSQYPLPIQMGGGMMKKTADIAMGISGFGERALKKVLPERVEKFLGLEKDKTVAEKLVPRELTKPETTGEAVGGLAVDLGIMFTDFPFKGLNLPSSLQKVSPVLNALDDFFKVGQPGLAGGLKGVARAGAKGAVEYGTKGGLLDRFSEESVKRGATTGAIAEMAVMGLTTAAKAVAPTKAKPKPGVVPEPIAGKPKVVPKPITQKPGYVPKPDDSMMNTPLTKKYTDKGWTSSSIMKKLKIKADATVKEVAQYVKRQMPVVGKQLDDATAKFKGEVDVSPAIKALRGYAKEQKKIGMSQNAELANELAMNLDFSPEVIRNGKMSMEEVVQWKQLWGKVTFQDPAAKWKKEVFDVAYRATREIAHQDKAIAKADDTFEALYALRDASRKAMPSVDAAAIKYEQAVERAMVDAIRKNAVQYQKYEQALEVAAKDAREAAIVAGKKYAQKAAIKAEEYTAKMAEADRVKYGIPTSMNPRAMLEYVHRVFAPAIKAVPPLAAEVTTWFTK